MKGEKAGKELPADKLSGLNRRIKELETKERQCKEAQAMVKRLHHQNELVLNAAGEGIFGLSIDGSHTFVNPAAAKMLGYSVDELVGRHSHTIWHYKRKTGLLTRQKNAPYIRLTRTVKSAMCPTRSSGEKTALLSLLNIPVHLSWKTKKLLER